MPIECLRHWTCPSGVACLSKSSGISLLGRKARKTTDSAGRQTMCWNQGYSIRQSVFLLPRTARCRLASKWFVLYTYAYNANCIFPLEKNVPQFKYENASGTDFFNGDQYRRVLPPSLVRRGFFIQRFCAFKTWSTQSFWFWFFYSSAVSVIAKSPALSFFSHILWMFIVQCSTLVNCSARKRKFVVLCKCT